MRYETKTLKDVITFNLKVNENTKSYFPSNYDYWCDLLIKELRRDDWNEVMGKLGDDMVEDMMKVFKKHFMKTLRELKESELF